MNVTERERLKKLAQDEYQRRLDAIEWVYQNTQRGGQVERQKHQRPAITPESETSVVAGNGNISVAKAFDRTLEVIDGNFTRERLQAITADNFPSVAEKLNPNYARAILARKVQEGSVEVVEPGGGKKLTVYRRKK